MIPLNYFKRQLEIRKLSTLHQKTIGSTIKHQRKKFKMTLEEGAEGICSVSYLSKVENNMIEPSDKFLVDFAKRFKLPDTHSIEDKKITELYEQIVNDTFYKKEIDSNINNFGISSYQGKLLQMIYQISQMNFEGLELAHEELSGYIKNFNNQEILMYVLFTAIELYYKGLNQYAYQLMNEIKEIEYDHYQLTHLITFWKLKHAFKINQQATILNEYKKELSLLIEHEYFELAQDLKLSYLEYLSKYENHLVFKNEVHKLISADKEIKFYLLAKNLYYHKQYELALELVEKTHTEHSYILKLKTLDTLGKEKDLKDLILIKNTFSFKENFYIHSYYKVKLNLSNTDVLEYLKETITLNPYWVDYVETNLFFLEHGLKEYQNRTFYKDGTNFSQFITRKLTLLSKS
ncbi:Transciptional regulator [Alteracholeplasma palmae J233]|uniref:Transciptional regulator n=1 Tax=Alteracholeplasma palmae (strain ATCC 49389 / J233) TaxID=1318466 RepID=U4KS68_ALTPJ|nr:helix-turn-helix transcriptional regulator [Alteracholeplasma palmae]CCV64771.1 Transciptional regulator [Alteracholeplasma palmae J233]